jgi:hypothetical protein
MECAMALVYSFLLNSYLLNDWQKFFGQALKITTKMAIG